MPAVNHLRNGMVEAQQLGITGTPAVLINGRKLKLRSMEGFQNLIDEEMETVCSSIHLFFMLVLTT